ncbi:uncharacterized protein PGTG_08066 [Puccinia graminis f. sp. tritici CRL 75-36-700-3]|uniref:RING-type domain-containing protein n=1 Tax=Puccinia graminis f. sp. tritici (strain CRL 75-36-700-3 / race SCCL) TaxID=418459 RepID=E3KC34_PUCGT|nr:uncharacterized protein PGTG_08065 [Puccinia graminis f. sp. tritici CRL 75-36-700-3]XP_003326236.1 uncharacterized protein PGTG_08066 [Puccinia graminis f. sp. tritici CRL 75-36-700-3]EFP81816.1 hypothetical protein PGTG_08065 [Puccinia graminis f. sp. tritici CRL 75-36-700-3]EFP81817.1 hypothetical protein PGTG_08066 [Puccinia graminis f. sp. tritici CRL 75-36-700-3]
MDRNILELSDTALSYLTPEYRQLFRRHFELFQAAHRELYENALRGRLTGSEDAHYFRYMDQVDDALERLGREDARRLQYISSFWMNAIEELEEIRAVSFERRRILVRRRLATLCNTTAATLASIRNGAVSACIVCMDELAPYELVIIRLPCHPFHLFHRDCIQHWLEGHTSCPICRIVVELPPMEPHR